MPEEFTLTPEFEYVEELNYKTMQTEFSLGYVQTAAYWQKPKRKFTLEWNAALREDRDYVVSFFNYHVGPAGAFTYQPVEPVAAPQFPGTPGAVAQTAGSYGSRTYYYQLVWVTAYGSTTPSSVRSFALSANNLFTFTIPRFPTNVTAARLYVHTSTSTQLQVELSVSGTKWTEPDISAVSNGLISGGSPPTTNTATEKINVHLLGDVLAIRKTSPVSYSMQLQFEEIPS